MACTYVARKSNAQSRQQEASNPPTPAPMEARLDRLECLIVTLLKNQQQSQHDQVDHLANGSSCETDLGCEDSDEDGLGRHDQGNNPLHANQIASQAHPSNSDQNQCRLQSDSFRQ